MPPKPVPMNMPIRPPRARPPSRPPNIPPKRPRRGCCAACWPKPFCGVVAFCCVLGVIDRLMPVGAAGAVLVVAGAEYVRVPRLPKPPPLARRASAKSTAVKETAIPIAMIANRFLKRRSFDNIVFSS